MAKNRVRVRDMVNARARFRVKAGTKARSHVSVRLGQGQELGLG